MSKVKVLENYGPVKTGHIYDTMREGYDYYVVRCCGQNIYVPKKFISFDIESLLKLSSKNEEDDDDFENYMDEYF